MDTQRAVASIVARATRLVESAKDLNPVATEAASLVCAAARRAVEGSGKDGFDPARTASRLAVAASHIADDVEIDPAPPSICRVAARTAASACCLAILGLKDAGVMKGAERELAAAESSMDLARMFGAHPPIASGCLIAVAA